MDEPAHFGAPPSISTFLRYGAGAVVDAAVSPDDITDHTSNTLREDFRRWRSVKRCTDDIPREDGRTERTLVGPVAPEEVRWITGTADATIPPYSRSASGSTS